MFIPSAILWTIEQRDLDKTNENIIGINSSLILNLASLVESFNKELMNAWIKEYSKITNENDDFLFKRLTDEFHNEIEQSEWNKQKILFTKIGDTEILNLIPEKILNEMNELFKFRNILTHGNKLSLIEWNYGGKIKYRLEPKKFDTLYNFLNKNGIVGNLKDVKINIFESIASNDVISFFIITVNQYLEKAKESFYLPKDSNPELFKLKI